MELTVPHFVYLAASDGEEAIWAQMLMVVILAAGGGIYAFIKTRPRSRRGSRGSITIHRNIFKRGINGMSHIIKTAWRHIPLERPAALQITAGHSSASSVQVGENVEKKYKINSVDSGVKLFHAGAKGRDLKGGMELLAGSFLAKIIESRQAGILADVLDIEMQKMCFAEMKRRNELEAVSSEALKTYTVDEAGYFGKTIQRQAMEELFRRTG